MVKALGSSEEAVFLQHRLDDMNQRWSDLKAKSANIRWAELQLILTLIKCFFFHFLFVSAKECSVFLLLWALGKKHFDILIIAVVPQFNILIKKMYMAEAHLIIIQNNKKRELENSRLHYWIPSQKPSTQSPRSLKMFLQKHSRQVHGMHGVRTSPRPAGSTHEKNTENHSWWYMTHMS